MHIHAQKMQPGVRRLAQGHFGLWHVVDGDQTTGTRHKKIKNRTFLQLFRFRTGRCGLMRDTAGAQRSTHVPKYSRKSPTAQKVVSLRSLSNQIIVTGLGFGI